MNARQEWVRMWPLPIVAMLGVSGTAIFAYAGGVFMEGVTSEFGWTRAQYSSAFMLMMVSGLFLAPMTGWLTDRIGPRKVALAAIVPFGVAISLFGLVSGKLWHWYAICLLLAVFQSAISQVVWIKAIVGRFEHSRGLAMAVTLAGLGFGSFIWPVIASLCIEAVGWRGAFPVMAAIYVAVALPLTYLFFHGAPGESPAAAKPAGKHGIGSAMRSLTFIGLVAAAGIFAACYYGLTMHFVPILKGNGMDLKVAAGIAGLIGVFSIVGRLVTGVLLDRFSTRVVGVAAFLLPLVSVACLLAFPGQPAAAIVAVAFLGLGSGAELDIVTFIVARRFGQAIFGAIYAVFMAVISICASIGPVIAGGVFDTSQAYGPWLWGIAPMFALAAAIVAWIPLSAEHGVRD